MSARRDGVELPLGRGGGARLEPSRVLPKPAHLGPEYAAQFGDAAIVAAYRHRPEYPAELFPVLAGLIAGESRTVLDAGCGTGQLARPLAALVERVDAVDCSAAMLAAGRRLPGGDRSNLRWLEGHAETAPIEPPYGLIVAGESVHWFDWAVALPRFRAALAPGAVLALVERHEYPEPWRDEMLVIINRYSTNREYRPYNLLDELAQRSLFRRMGEVETAPAEVVQTIDDYIELAHSRNGLSRDRMTPEGAAAFDTAMRALLERHTGAGPVRYRLAGRIVWGEPAPDGPG